MIEVLALTEAGECQTYIVADRAAGGLVHDLLGTSTCVQLHSNILVWAGRQGIYNLPASWIAFHLGGPRTLLRGLAVFTGSWLLSAQGLQQGQRLIIEELHQQFQALMTEG